MHVPELQAHSFDLKKAPHLGEVRCVRSEILHSVFSMGA